MNIHRIKNSSNYILLFCCFIVLVGCNAQTPTYKLDEIWIAKEVKDKGYIYSEDSQLKLSEKLFSLRYKAFYGINGEIVQLKKYLPEGSLIYGQEDLRKDKQIYMSVGIPQNLSWTIKDNKIIKGNSKVFAVENLTDSLFCQKLNDNSIIFKIR